MALPVPVLFLHLGVQVFGQRKKASAFAILDAQGANHLLVRLLEQAAEGRRQWRELRGPEQAAGTLFREELAAQA